MQYRSILNLQRCKNCPLNSCCFLRRVPLRKYNELTQNFIINIPKSAYRYSSVENKWFADYREVQNYLLNYYDIYSCRVVENQNYAMTPSAQKESDKELIKKQFKNFLDVAAKATENENPQLSIMFDGIGLIMASDYIEAVNKVFSMMKTANGITMYSKTDCRLSL